MFFSPINEDKDDDNILIISQASGKQFPPAPKTSAVYYIYMHN